MIRVGIIGTRGYPSTYGGFETLVRHLAPHLRDHGFDVTVYCRGRHRGLRSTADDVDGIHCVHTAGIDGKTTSTLSFGLTSAWHGMRAHYDAVLVVNVANGFYLPLLRRARVPTAVNVDGIEWERAKWNALGQRVFLAGARLTARYADEIVADNGAIADIWHEKFGVKSRYIPYGADIVDDAASDRIEALGIEPGGYVLAVARLVPENNVELLLDAIDRIGDRVPTVIVGSAVERSALEARLNRLAADRPEFHWLGHVHDQELLQQLWANCGVYFYGATVGGTGPALLQGLGCGSPVVAFDTPQNREVFGTSEPLVALDGVERLAGRIGDVLGDVAERAELSRLGRRIVQERYQWDVVCSQYAELMRDLAERRGRLSPCR